MAREWKQNRLQLGVFKEEVPYYSFHLLSIRFPLSVPLHFSALAREWSCDGATTAQLQTISRNSLSG